MKLKSWSHEPIQRWSSLYELVKIRNIAIKPAWLLITLVIELKQVCIYGRGLWNLYPFPFLRLTKFCSQYQAIKCQYLIIFGIIKYVFQNIKTEFT